MLSFPLTSEPIVKVLKREEFVIPTKVGHAVKHQRYPVFSICCKNFWIPVCTGMTVFAIGSQEYIQLTFLPTHIYKKFIVILFLVAIFTITLQIVVMSPSTASLMTGYALIGSVVLVPISLINFLSSSKLLGKIAFLLLTLLLVIFNFAAVTG